MARNTHHPSSNTSSLSPATSNGVGPVAQQLIQLQTQHTPNLNTQRTVKSAPPTTNAPLASNGQRRKRRASAKEVREWLNLVGVLLIPLLIGIYTIVNNNQQATIAQQNRQADITNQLDQQRENTLKTYEDDMSSLLLDRHLRTSQPGDEVRIVALTKTLQALHRLDWQRNAQAIQFLQDAHLIGLDLQHPLKIYTIIDFSGTDLSYDDLSYVNLNGVELHEINLSGAHLTGANLIRTNLIDANLSGAHLQDAEVTQQQLSEASSLKGATMPDGSTHS